MSRQAYCVVLRRSNPCGPTSLLSIRNTGQSILAAFSRMHSTGHCQTETDDFELAQDLVKKMDAWPNVFKLDLRGHGGVTPGARGGGLVGRESTY